MPNHRHAHNPTTPPPLTIAVQQDSNEQGRRWDLQATADHRVLARAWVQEDRATGLYTTTIRNHPADWRRDIAFASSDREEAVAFARQGLRHIVGTPKAPPTCFFAETRERTEIEVSLNPYSGYWESWKRPATQPRRITVHPDLRSCIDMTVELTGLLSGWAPHDPTDTTQP